MEKTKDENSKVLQFTAEALQAHLRTQAQRNALVYGTVKESELTTTCTFVSAVNGKNGKGAVVVVEKAVDGTFSVQSVASKTAFSAGYGFGPQKHYNGMLFSSVEKLDTFKVDASSDLVSGYPKWSMEKVNGQIGAGEKVFTYSFLRVVNRTLSKNTKGEYKLHTFEAQVVVDAIKEALSKKGKQYLTPESYQDDLTIAGYSGKYTTKEVKKV